MSAYRPLFSRRNFLAGAASLPVFFAPRWGWGKLLQSPEDDAASGSGGINWGPTSFIVNGKPRFLTAGTMDYFRCPAELWRDRILKAKRAGLNTIMTYVAWNQHEPEEGNFRFNGRSDIAKFLRTCAELEMLAFVRTGPFMCDEFEMGGHPAWLLSKPGIALRIRSEVAEPYIERWLAQLCKQIAPLQSSHGGPVILVQAENEYYYSQRPGAIDYLEFLYRTLRRGGIEVPITGCGNGQEQQAPEYFETINGYGPGALASFRKAHPTWPLLISEHYTDWFDAWTWPQTDYPKRPMLEQESMAALSQGVMLSYFCFHGGTNFGFNGSSSWKTDHTWITNRYFGQGPIGEGGALNPNYFAAKSASLPVAQFEDFFTSAVAVPSPLSIDGPVKASALRSERGTLVFVLPAQPISADQRFLAGEDSKPVTLLEERDTLDIEAATGVITLPSGARVPLAAGSARSLMLPIRFHVDSRHGIDYANATLLGIGGTEIKRVILLWGEAGREGHVSVDGVAGAFRFPQTEPREVTLGHVTVLALSSEMADRTWFADGRVLIGPAFVGKKVGAQHQCLVDVQTGPMLAIEQDGTIHRRSLGSIEAEATTGETALSWTRAALAEPRSGSEGWKPLQGPRSTEELGAYYGYSWYRARVSSAARRNTGLLFTSAADRAHVWANGRYCGVYGRGAGAARDLLPVEFAEGETVITLLVDNMGRSSEGSTQQRKGIFGPVYAGATAQPLPLPALLPSAIPEGTTWQFHKYKADSSERARCTTATWKISTRRGRGLFLALRQMPQYAWIQVNGVPIGEHHGDNSLLDGFAASEYILPAGTNPDIELTLSFFGETDPDLARSVQLYSFPEDGALHHWEFRPWVNPVANTHPAHAPEAAADGPKEPCWWQAEFARPLLKPPLFFETQRLSKGQLYLNGEPTGRYWKLGPHHRVYLPEPWLRDVNTLALLDESGASPSATFFMRDANVPTTMVTF